MIGASVDNVAAREGSQKTTLSRSSGVVVGIFATWTIYNFDISVINGR